VDFRVLFAHNKQTNFLRQPKEKNDAKKEKNGARKNIGSGKFWLMRIRQAKILYILVPNLGEIYVMVTKISFFSKTKAFLASWQPKDRFNG